MRRANSSGRLRLPFHDYSSDGYYFITFNAKNRQHFFGEIKKGIMGLSPIGCIVAKYWQEIPDHYDNATLDQWVIMPDHVHGIIALGPNPDPCGASPWTGPTGENSIKMQPQFNEFGKMVPKSISCIINQFKGAVTTCCRRNGYPSFAWQSKFYDHIVRNDEELHRIRQYIKNNPLKWTLDGK